jgi:hypothetical protein
MKINKKQNLNLPKNVVFIIGAGPNGILASKILLSHGFEVNLIEAGTRFEEAHLNLSSYRWKAKSKMPKGVHQVGGGTAKWHGRLSKFPEEIFTRSGEIYAGSWPIKHDEFETFYVQLLNLLKIEKLEFSSQVLSKFHKCNACVDIIELSPFQTLSPNTFVEMFDSLEKYKNFKFFPNTFCESFENISPNIIKLTCLNRNQKKITLRCNYVFISCGALQSPALIKRSFFFESRKFPIGKYLIVGNLVVSKNNFNCLTNFVSKSPDRTLHANFGSGIFSSGKKLTTYHIELVEYRRTYIFDKKLNKYNFRFQFLLSTLFELERLITFLPNRIWRRFHILRGNKIYSVWLKGEELPHVNSTVEIDQAISSKVVYNHRISIRTRVAIVKNLKNLSMTLSKNNLGRLKYFWHLLNPMFFRTGGNFHPMGTLRMSGDLAKSVVDSNNNLVFDNRVFIIDSSVFPVGGFQNPTFNSLTLTLRAVQLFIDKKLGIYRA